MAKFRLIVAVLLLAGMALVLGLQYSADKRLREENGALKLALAELKQAQEGREPVSKDDSSSKEQLAELLRLRGEVTQLRQQTNQITALEDENKKLLVSFESAKQASKTIPEKKRPLDALPQDIHPKETWAFRGYGTPDATVESLCWAMANGDKATFMAGLCPEMLAQVEKESEGKDFAEDIKKVSNEEFRILDRQQLSDDQMELTIYTTWQNPNGGTTRDTDKTVFQRINGEWKVTDKHAPEN
jgi:hypothetical protein